MKTGVIRRNINNETGFRIDPSFHLSEALQIQSDLRNSPYPLHTVAEVSEKVFIGNIFSRNFVTKPDHGVPYLAASDTVLGHIDSGKYLSKNQAQQLSYLMLDKGWILVTCSGTLGNVTFTNSLFSGHIATHDLIRIIPSGQIIKPGVLYAFLSSKYGYFQLTQSKFGGVVKHINSDQAGSVCVPVFSSSFQDMVDSLIQESARLRDEAVSIENTAIKFFDDKFPFDDAYTKVFCRSINNFRLGIAAFNNNLEVDKFISLFAHDAVRIKDLTEKVFAPSLFKHIYLSKDNGYPFMTGSELTRYNLRYYRWLSPKGVKDINDYIVHKNTLLLYKSGTTDGGILGNVFIADDKLDGCCLSDHVIRIIFKDSRVGNWAYAFLRSKGGVKLLQSLATGTMIPFIVPERVSELLIPKPDGNLDRISSLIEAYIEKIARSKSLDDKAVSMVENEIESWKNN